MTDPEKVKHVAKWPTPTGIKDLQKFLGLASYYRKFIKNVAQIAAPLHHFTKQSKKYCWTPEFEEAVNAINPLGAKIIDANYTHSAKLNFNKS